jgi:hypothetical protein
VASLNRQKASYKCDKSFECLGEEPRMSTESSEQMMELLKELALLKQLDEKEERGEISDENIIDLESRENRRREITQQIKALGEAAS